ncbi:MFS transporter [Brucepastera parasyntrophica]|uniref:MFS transporter n=1 Tax=Brucepastera parasyntrophica TaxID=2880008 RepID=UPI00210B9798|nr:MFS transporter [Brucepastera parasyntrophica]ULQ59687.1 MFS transporter [Brucepastera parasyntrophica]
MKMGAPLFFLFSIYGVINTYLPILLSSLGYGPGEIGIFLGLFEASGLLFPIFISSRIDKRGNYGQILLLFGILMFAVMPLLLAVNTFWFTALVLIVYAVGFKGAIPVSDALVYRLLGSETEKYGRIRVFGSIGFVCITLFLQISKLVNPSVPSSIIFWLGLTSLLFSLSLVCIPGLLKRRPTETLIETENHSIIGIAEVKEESWLEKFPPVFWFGILLVFLGYLGLVPSQRFFSLYVREFLHLESYAGLWALASIVEIPFMFLSGWFIRKLGTGKIILISLAVIVLRNCLYAIFPSFQGAVAGQLCHSVGFGLFHPAAVIFVCKWVSRRNLAVGMTLYTSVAVGAANVLGNLAGGFVIESLGYLPLFYLFALPPLIGIGLLVSAAKRYKLFS